MSYIIKEKIRQQKAPDFILLQVMMQDIIKNLII